MKWIPIKKQLPPLFKGVLVSDGIIVTTAERLNHSWTLHEADGYEWEWNFSTDAITYWSHLPKPPRK